MSKDAKKNDNPPSPLPEELTKALEARYIMLTMNRFIAFLGGAVGFLILVGVISWEITLSALKTGQGKLSLSAIQAEAVEAEKLGGQLREIKTKADADASHTAELIDARIARTDQLTALRQQKSALQNQIAAAKAAKGLNSISAQQRLPGLQKQLKDVEEQIAKIESEK